MSKTLKVNGLCRCCLSEGEFRSLDAPYKCDGNDSYSALLQETLNITINPMPGPDNASTYTICDGCASRLQDAAQFRSQVLECETKFAAYVENYLRGDCSFSADKIQLQVETLQDEEIEQIKEEMENINDNSPDEGDNYINEFDCKIEVCDGGNRIGDAPYSCDICNENFCRKDKLRSHVLDNHIFSQDSSDLSGLSCDRTFNGRRAEYHCAFCTDTFPKLKSLKSHELAHTKKSGFICDYCQKRFSDKRKLKNHIYYHTGNYICETCGYFTKKASTLRVHIRNEHDDKMCPLKSGSIKSHNSKSVLKDRKDGNYGNIFSQDSRDFSGLSHDRTFNRARAEYHCSFCTDTFSKLKILKSHELAHTEKSGFICDYCQKRFSDKRKLKKHIYYHTGNYICETCGYFTTKASTLRVHIRNVHDDKRWRLNCASIKSHNSMSDLKDHKDGNYGNIFSQDSRDISGLSQNRTFNRRRAEYHCAFCTDTFPKLKSLKSHELAHTEKFGFICDYCQKSFSDKNKLKIHINYHIGNYKCGTCGHFTEKASHLRVHIRNVHEKIRPFKCDLCPKTYQTKNVLMEHRSVHTGEFLYKCDVCFKSFRFRSSLNAHKHRHLLKSKQGQARLGMESRPDNFNNECPICAKSFEYKYLLRKHLNTHTKPFQCDVCGKSFSRKAYMVQHQRLHYPGKRETKTERKKCSGVNKPDDVEYSCDFCKQIFCGNDKLRSHLLAKHMSLDPRNISCPSCGIKFKGRETCLKHLMQHKTAQYHCDFCIDTFLTPGSLRAHEKTHTKKFGYTCDYCQRGFKLKISLINHINEHNMGNVRTYVCETCGFITTQESVLKVHVRAVHEKLRPFKCDLCPKSYKLNKHLLEHKRLVHAGVLHYKCDVCSRCFRSKSNINKHKRRHKH